jgi:hypothetical protein
MDKLYSSLSQKKCREIGEDPHQGDLFAHALQECLDELYYVVEYVYAFKDTAAVEWGKVYDKDAVRPPAFITIREKNLHSKATEADALYRSIGIELIKKWPLGTFERMAYSPRLLRAVEKMRGQNYMEDFEIVYNISNELANMQIVGEPFPVPGNTLWKCSFAEDNLSPSEAEAIEKILYVKNNWCKGCGKLMETNKTPQEMVEAARPSTGDHAMCVTCAKIKHTMHKVMTFYNNAPGLAKKKVNEKAYLEYIAQYKQTPFPFQSRRGDRNDLTKQHEALRHERKLTGTYILCYNLDVLVWRCES